jgi:CO/xanthine dehydrogenase Mo-binding subunit
MLHARLVRSPYAHARILSVDLAGARAIPGVIAVIGPDDVHRDSALDPWFGPFLADQPVLPLDRVRYAGEPVVAVAAVDEQTAQAAADAVVVRYEALPAVLDIDAALADGAPLVHSGARRLVSHRADIVARQPGLADTNVIHTYRLRRGDIKAGFAAADVVVERTYRSPAAQHVPLETHVAVAEFGAGGLTMWASSQAPSMLAAMLAGILRVPSSDVRVIVSTLGGGYGAKVDPTIEPIVALLAREARRPVRLSLDRYEEFLTATKHAAKVRIRTGARRDGTLVAHEATCWYDGGAYAKDTPEKLLRGYASTGPYRVPNIHVDSFGVYTNRVPSCAFRGFGIPQVAWAHEAQMDQLADALGRDPLDLRRQNILVEGDPFSTGEILEEDPHYLELLDDAARRIGWTWPATPARDGPRVRATGVSAIIKGA